MIKITSLEKEMSAIKRFFQIISLVLTIIVFSLSVHTNAIANTVKSVTSIVEIKYLSNAQIFASFTDELPAVLNYFTVSSQQDIIMFYKKHYGDVLSQELKRKRLTLKFNHNQHNIRVVISAQNQKQQVDVLVEK